EFSAPYAIHDVALSGTSLKISWSDSCNFEKGFKIFRLSGEDWKLVGTVANNQYYFVDEGLSYNTLQNYYIVGFTDHNESLKSSTYYAKVILSAPSGLSTTPLSDHEIQLNWQDNSLFEEGFILERRSGVAGSWEDIASLNADQVSYIDATVISNREYAYRVKAYTENIESAYSNQVIGKVDFPSPVNLQVTSLNEYSAKIGWTDNCTFETGYLFSYYQDGSADTIKIQLPANTDQFTLDDIAKDRIYHIIIQAVTETNVSAPLTGIIRFSDSYASINTSAWSGEPVNAIDFSVDGSLIALGRDGNTCDIWNPVENAKEQSVPGSAGDDSPDVQDVAFAHDQPWLALGNSNGKVRIVNINDWMEIDTLFVNSYQLSACQFSLNDAFIAAAQHRFIYIWNTSDWSFSKTLSEHNEAINDIALSANGEWLASAGNDDIVNIWSADADWTHLQSKNDFSSDVLSLCFSPNSQYLAVGVADGEVRLYSTIDWSSTVLRNEGAGVVGLSFTAENNSLAAAFDGSNEIEIWSIPDGELVTSVTVQSQSVTDIKYSADGNLMAASYGNGDIGMWNVSGQWQLIGD
ncbi:MAG: fibronectin type III domain-containing protein, partial [Calditrichaceae bacterium]